MKTLKFKMTVTTIRVDGLLQSILKSELSPQRVAKYQTRKDDVYIKLYRERRQANSKQLVATIDMD